MQSDKPIYALLFTADRDALKAELTTLGGHITQVFSARVVEAMFDTAPNLERLQHGTPETREALDEIEAAWVEAWRQVNTGETAGAIATVASAPT